MYSGSMVYETPQGTQTFGPGSGGLVNANVLHSTRNLPGTKVVSWIPLFEPSLLGGSVGSRIEQKYLAPITANPALELLALDPADPDQAALLEKLRDSFALDENEFGYELRLRAALGEIWLGLLALPRPEARPGAECEQPEGLYAPGLLCHRRLLKRHSPFIIRIQTGPLL